MMETVTEQELQAYLDDALPLERRAAVEAYLEHNPEARERLRAYRRLQDDIGALFEPALREPVPPRLLAAPRCRRRPRCGEGGACHGGRAWPRPY
ncbi:hypothetical protein JOS77_23910 [Chromobacterium haemolyticum]|nr:hypothetical protein JOS77_23910 [Chromobacterium haemolyticum]